MWIRKIKINNFKSLVDFEIDLAKFNCLIGLNGSGKSTVLQAIDFLAQLIRGDVKGWLRKRQWKPRELVSNRGGQNYIDFCVTIVREDVPDLIEWSGLFDINELYCVSEVVRMGDSVIELENGEWTSSDLPGVHPVVQIPGRNKIIWKYEGSVLSSFARGFLSNTFLHKTGVVYYFGRTKSFDMLSPSLLRRQARNTKDSIGFGGEDFAAYLDSLAEDGRSRLIERLKQVYPNLDRIEVESATQGRKKVKIVESFGVLKTVTTARHMNDGLLRLAAMIAMLESHFCFLLFDEIENGINAELVDFLIEALTQAKQQIIVTTHSPMILNFLEDDVARQSVIYLDKREDGTTRATPFFKIPSLDRKLSVMGPGEAFVDTDLLHLGDEIDRMAESG